MRLLLQERGPFSELQTALVLYECLKVIAACHVSLIASTLALSGSLWERVSAPVSTCYEAHKS